MDVRTIENRLREIAGGADMITLSGIMQYTGADYDWIKRIMQNVDAKPVGGGRKGKRYHILYRKRQSFAGYFLQS